MRIRILLSLLVILSISSLKAQIQYTIQLERPENVSDEDIKALFAEYTDIRQVQVGGNRLTLTVPNKDDYPILTIREILAQKQVAATDVQSQPGHWNGASKKSLESAQFIVYGKCGMCKDRIERATRSVKGVVMANWSEETQQLTLKYLPGKTDVAAIQQAIAAVGHDTDAVRAADDVYNTLHTCCKYDRPAALEK
ncbi:MAG: hypothetical protein K9I85_01270 [Saprospiraceae bacterium]|nr:hypothetical protein [Saprospiraceae bacterium]